MTRRKRFLKMASIEYHGTFCVYYTCNSNLLLTLSQVLIFNEWNFNFINQGRVKRSLHTWHTDLKVLFVLLAWSMCKYQGWVRNKTLQKKQGIDI